MTSENNSDIISAEQLAKSVNKFEIADGKIESFCLRKGAKHWSDFENVGYSKSSGKVLRKQLKDAFENGDRTEIEEVNGNVKFAIYCDLGITKKKRFCTAWQIDKGSTKARFISAYRKDG